MVFGYVTLFLILFLCCLTSGEVSESFKTCDQLFQEGVNAYLDESWQDCIDILEKALSEYHLYKQTILDCRRKCQYQAASSPHIYKEDVEDLHFYEDKIKKTLCLMKCKPNYFQDRHYLTKTAQDYFENKKPYEYLQLCYYQKHQFQKAASAAFTFLASNPENEIMRSNLKFYSTLPEVDMAKIENFEALPYVLVYINGLEAYSNEEYSWVIQYMEESLENYLKAHEDCRSYCEGPFDHGWFPDFTPAISNHFTFCLKCKNKCPDSLNLVNGEKHQDLLPSHYHYLQYSYFKVGEMKKACEAVATYLLFDPMDETMLQNKKYYLKMPKVSEEYFRPRKEAVKYILTQEYEKKLLEFIETNFHFEDTDENEIKDD